MANAPQTAITLVVHDLDVATSFYLSALRPLGYQVVSKVQHQTDYTGSVAVGIGPVNTTRVDLFLSALPSGSSPPRHHKSAHVVFPAKSRAAVCDFYGAGLHAGGRPVARPDTKGGVPGLFAAIVQDIDGNKVEVCYSEPYQYNGSLLDRVESSIAASAPEPFYHDRREPPPGVHNHRGHHGHPPLREDMAAGNIDGHRSRRSSFGSEKGHSSSRSAAGEINPKSKAVVGTILGAAAGAAAIYAFTKDPHDSKDSRGDERDHMKDAARQRAYATAWREKAARSRGERMDRDSGYYSGSSQRRDLSPDVLRREPSHPRPRRRSSFGDRYQYPDRGHVYDIDRERDRESAVSSMRTVTAADQRRGPSPRRTRSRRDGPPSHASVSELPSEPRPISRSGGRYVESRPAPKSIPYHTITVRSPPQDRDRDRDRERDSPPSGSTRTIRYIPVSGSGRREPAPPSHHGFPVVPGAIDDDEFEVYDPDSDDGLDDETVVPDDSISVAPSDGPSHKVDRHDRPHDRPRERERERRSARRDVAAH